jgi:AcrR family transcriptional regulator
MPDTSPQTPDTDGQGSRTQQDRSTRTQAALLTATIDCLVEYGYAGTTTRLVADRAGVSRGAQTHHYPTKHDLVVAAIEQLFDAHLDEFTRTFRAVPAEGRTLDRAVGVLWDVVSGPTYAAVLEVVVASRTDDELRAVVHAVAARLERSVAELLLWFAPDLGDLDAARSVVDLAFALVQGAAVSRTAGFGRPEQVIDVARALAPFAVQLTARPTTEDPR